MVRAERDESRTSRAKSALDHSCLLPTCSLALFNLLETVQKLDEMSEDPLLSVSCHRTSLALLELTLFVCRSRSTSPTAQIASTRSAPYSLPS